MGGGDLKLTLHRECDEISACFRTLLRMFSGRRREFQWQGRFRTLDQSSMSSSPAVVLMITLPLVGSAIERYQSSHVTRVGRWAGALGLPMGVLLDFLPMYINLSIE